MSWVFSLALILVSIKSLAAPLALFEEGFHPEVQLINAPATSCFAWMYVPNQKNDVAARHLEIPAPRILWRSTASDLHITNIHIQIAGFPLGVPLKFDISGDELRALFANDNMLVENVIPRAPAEDKPSEKILACPLTVGGIQLTPAQDVYFIGSGFVTFQGFTRADDGVENEVELSFEFTLQNGQEPEGRFP